MVRFCEYEEALLGDFTKSYHSMLSGIVEMHTRRVVWRWGDEEADWTVFGWLVVSFGDRPAAVLLFIVERITRSITMTNM